MEQHEVWRGYSQDVVVSRCSSFHFSLPVLWHGPSIGCIPFGGGVCFGGQEGSNVSAIDELLCISGSSETVQMPSSFFRQLLLKRLRGPDQRQPPCTAAESYPCNYAHLHTGRRLLLEAPLASSLPGEKLRSHS